ncbi:MAG TPA: C10 family peptidase [Paludibacteraceae bacterium]|nr:C10 family peptidase [Paludibacteraceae bacterium]
MKKNPFRLFLSVLLIAPCFAFTQSVSSESAASKALSFINTATYNASDLIIQPLSSGGIQSAWLVRLPDKRFVIISADSLMQPVLAYGDSISGMESDKFSTWQKIMASDYTNRLVAIRSGYIPSQKALWSEPKSRLFQQWPPAGTTPTGGWLSTNWTQSSPYNKLCPMDLNAGNRSVVGCPATAMAQICNYYMTVNSTQFSDADDYYHNFGNGNRYWIDDAHAERDFPDFPELNQWLDTIQQLYLQNLPITDSMKAALSFAAGVAAKQVYSASVSGTYGIDQAQMAYQRFNFDLSELIGPASFELTSRVAADMKAAMVDHLGIVDAAVTVGHNVVIDGYNTDEFYHFNFGWGGAYNGWYTLPPSGMPYSLNVIEGVVVNIKNTYAHASPWIKNTPEPAFAFMPGDNLRISGIDITGSCELRLFNVSGALVLVREFTAVKGNEVMLNTPGLSPGIYLCLVHSAGKMCTGKAVKP